MLFDPTYISFPLQMAVLRDMGLWGLNFSIQYKELQLFQAPSTSVSISASIAYSHNEFMRLDACCLDPGTSPKNYVLGQ